MFFRRMPSVLLGMLLFLMLTACGDAKPTVTTFSDVFIHEETGDVLGTELLVFDAGDGPVTGEIRFYEGSDCPSVRLSLSGTIEDSGVRLQGPGGKFQLTGRISDGHFLGRLHGEQEVDLPLTEAPIDVAVSCGGESR